MKLHPGAPIVWRAIVNHDTGERRATLGIVEKVRNGYVVFTFSVRGVSGRFQGIHRIEAVELEQPGTACDQRVGEWSKA
jgi:hypothetical protein